MPEVIGNFLEVEAYLLSLIPRSVAAGKTWEEASTRVVAEEAARRAPVLSGHMKASIGEEGSEVIVDTPYAGYVENGTRRMEAQPFLRPARDVSEPVVYAMAEEIFTVATR